MAAQEPIFSRKKETLYLDIKSNEASLGNQTRSELAGSSRLRARYDFTSSSSGANHGLLISQTWKRDKDGKWQSESISIVFKDYINNTEREKKSSGYSSNEIIDMVMAYFPFTARVVDRTGNDVDIDIGTGFGVVMGDRFDVINQGRRTGLIQVTSPSENTARAKILSGDPLVGSTVQARLYLQQAGISFQYFGNYPVTADINRDFEANTGTKTPSLGTALLWRVDFNLYRYAGWSFSIGASVLRVGDTFSPFLAYLEGQGGIEIIPELLELYIGAAGGLGAGFKQKYADKPATGYITSPGETPLNGAYALDVFGGFRLMLTRSFLLYGDAGYRSVFVGGKISKEGPEVKDEWLQYRNIKVGGFVPRVGFTVLFGD
jgi:hypothetical protein